MSRQQVEATAWLNNGFSPLICGANADANPEAWLYGFYRRLDSGKLEFVPFCDQQSKRWISIRDDDFKKILDGLGMKSVIINNKLRILPKD